MDTSTVYFERLSNAQSSQFSISINRSYKPAPRTVSYEHDEYSQVEPGLIGKFARHNKYGKGKIMAQHGEGENTQVEILFADGVNRKFVLKYANLSFV